MARHDCEVARCVKPQQVCTRLYCKDLHSKTAPMLSNTFSGYVHDKNVVSRTAERFPKTGIDVDHCLDDPT